MPRQRPEDGDVFTIQLDENTAALGQILSVERDAMDSIGCAFWDPSSTPPDLKPDETPLAVLLVTPDLLRRGTWKIVSRAKPALPRTKRPYEGFRSGAWVGAKIIGSGIVVKLLQGAAGILPWDDFADRNYLDGLLYPGRTRPQLARLINAA